MQVIASFDFKMVSKLGRRFELSGWARNRSLLIPNGLDLVLDTISPCNMAMDQDTKNVSWVGYLGQTVPSGNLIGGPICVDRHGDVVTRTCGLPSAPRNQYQVEEMNLGTNMGSNCLIFIIS